MQRWGRFAIGCCVVLTVGCGRVSGPVRAAWSRVTDDRTTLPLAALASPLVTATAATAAETGPTAPTSTARLVRRHPSGRRVPPASSVPVERPLADLLPGSRRIDEPAVVYLHPRADAPALGLLAAGTHVGVFAVDPAESDAEACEHGQWLSVAPRGWVCAPTQTSSRKPSTQLLPRVPKRGTTPGTYGKVRDGAPIYASRNDAAMGLPPSAPDGSLTVQRLGTETIDGVKYWRTRSGLIPARDVRRHNPSRFVGVSLREDTHALPVAWTLAPATSERSSVPVYAEARRRSRVVKRLPARTLVVVSEEKDGFASTPYGWIDRHDLRIARAADVPPTLQDGESWIDIDLDAQVLVAYEGTEPVYATLISSGKVNHRTPTGVFRIERKIAERTMNSMADSDETYRVAKVPWTAYFARGYALHAAYWHNGFGRARSHGCVNLAPRDARALYDWMVPAAAPGWSESYGHVDQPGTLVRVRSRKDPTPPVKGYARAWLPEGLDELDEEVDTAVAVADTEPLNQTG